MSNSEQNRWTLVREGDVLPKYEMTNSPNTTIELVHDKDSDVWIWTSKTPGHSDWHCLAPSQAGLPTTDRLFAHHLMMRAEYLMTTDRLRCCRMWTAPEAPRVGLHCVQLGEHPASGCLLTWLVDGWGHGSTASAGTHFRFVDEDELTVHWSHEVRAEAAVVELLRQHPGPVNHHTLLYQLSVVNKHDRERVWSALHALSVTGRVKGNGRWTRKGVDAAVTYEWVA